MIQVLGHLLNLQHSQDVRTEANYICETTEQTAITSYFLIDHKKDQAWNTLRSLELHRELHLFNNHGFRKPVGPYWTLA